MQRDSAACRADAGGLFVRRWELSVGGDGVCQHQQDGCMCLRLGVLTNSTATHG